MQQDEAVDRHGVNGAQQRHDEWFKLDEIQLKYHKQQWDTPKQSTKAMEVFVADKLNHSRTVIDLGCGAGAATAFFAGRYPHVKFEGRDFVDDLLVMADAFAHERQLNNLAFRQADWFALEAEQGVDGVISLQTLSWLSEFERPLSELFTKLSPEWFAMNSLFYDGEISCKIEVNEHKRGAKSFYNIYSIDNISRFSSRYGYKLTKIERFEIDIDIDPPADRDTMGTYTRKVEGNATCGGERLQISGPLLLPWHMLLFEKGV